MTASFLISDICISIDHDSEFSVSDAFSPFLTQEKPTYKVVFRESDIGEYDEKEFSISQSFCKYKGHGFEIMEDQNGTVFRKYYDPLKGFETYALGFFNPNKNEVLIRYIRSGLLNLNHTLGAFFHAHLEMLLLRESRVIYHAACVKTKLGGILFSGHSGVGKSTQAKLWCEYEDAQMINGDRPILHIKEDECVAYGSPYAGSSRCYVNDSTEVKAVVFLKKASACSIRKLDTKSAYRRILEQITLNIWDGEFVSSACELAEQMLRGVPVYEMDATIDSSSVNFQN